MKGARDRLKLIQFASILAAILISACVTSRNPWNEAKSPARGAPEPIGFYSAGCLRGAKALPLDGDGYHITHPSRRRFFGHPDLIALIKSLGEHAKKSGSGDLLIGDLGLARGGPTLSGHASHQIGLDVDIWFERLPKTASGLTEQERENQSAPSMLKSVNGEPAAVSDLIDTSRWGAAQIEALRWSVEDPRVERIFVNPSLKQWLCLNEPHTAWLHKLRPWWGHDDHFHVRLKCPASAPLCKPQEAVDPGSGCDSTLGDWFSVEMRAQAKQKDQVHKPNPMPTLPPQCAEVLNVQ